MSRPRVVIADHQIVAEGLRRLLEPDFDIVATAGSGPELLNAVLRYEPDLATMEVSVPALSGTDTVTKLKALSTTVKVAFITQQQNSWMVSTALRVGVTGYVLKQQSPEEMRMALRKVAQGGTYVAPRLQDLSRWGRTARGNKPGSQLTPRQTQVLQLLAEGRTTKQIGEELGVSAKTAEFHRAGLMETLGIHTVAQLTRFAIEHGVTAAV